MNGQTKYSKHPIGDNIYVWGPEYDLTRDSYVFAFMKGEKIVYLFSDYYGDRPNYLQMLSDLQPAAREAFNGPGN